MQLEHDYLEALHQAERFEVEGDMLTIDCGVTLPAFRRT